MVIFYLVLIFFIGCTTQELTSSVEVATSSMNLQSTQTSQVTLKPYPSSTPLQIVSLAIDSTTHISGLSGNLLLVNETEKVFLTANLADYSISENPIPSGCQLLSNLKKAICKSKSANTENIIRLSIYDLESKTSTLISEGPFESNNIFLNPQQTKISCYKKETEELYILLIYDIETGKLINQYSINRENWMSLPIPSSIDDIYWGLQNRDGFKTILAKWLPTKNQIIPVYLSNDYTATGEFGISQDGDKIFVGAWSIEPNEIVDTYETLLIYQDTTGITKVFSSVEDYSFQWLATHFYNPWSATNKLLAMEVLTNRRIDTNSYNYYRGICIIDSSSLKASCQNDFQEGIISIAWSPDSKFLAIATIEGRLYVFSILEQKLYLLGIVKSQGTFDIKLIWN